MPRKDDQTEKPTRVINDASMDAGNDWKNPTDVVAEARREDEEDDSHV